MMLATRCAREPLCFLVSISLLLFFFQLGARDLVSSHEARAAQNAQRMLDTGEWGLPILFDGQADLQKPPGYYWLVAVVGFVNGGHVAPWVARFPAAASAFVAVLLVYGFLRREGYPAGALVAAIALATANHFVAIGRTARIDVSLTCAIAVSLLAFYRKSYLITAVAAGFAVLLKGPIALALIGSTAVAFSFVERECVPLRAAILGLLVFAAVAVPWFAWAQFATNGDFVRVFFWHHNVARFAGTSEALAAHPWWFYGPRFAFAFLPWTLLLLPLGVWGLRCGLWREDRLFRFGIVWTVVMVAVLSASRFKRADYILPAFAGAAIVLGCAAERWLTLCAKPRAARRAKLVFGALLVSAVAVWPVMWFVVEPAEAGLQEKQPFAVAIRAHAPAPQTILLFRTESHLLAYHLGAPLHTMVEWGELQQTLATPGPHVVVMPPEYVADAERITRRKLVPVAALADYTTVEPQRPLVSFRTQDLPPNPLPEGKGR